MPTRGYVTSSGTPVPGVTTVISLNLGWNKDPLMYWAWSEGKNGRDFRKSTKKAADVGTIAHAMVEADLLGRPFDGSKYEGALLEQAQVPFAAYREWRGGVSLAPEKLEEPLVSEKLMVGGTIDCVARLGVGGKPVLAICDWKTAKGIYADHIVQVAAYRAMWNELHPDEQISEVHILRFGKETAEFEHHGPLPEETKSGSKLPGLVDALKIFRWLRGLHEVKCRMDARWK